MKSMVLGVMLGAVTAFADSPAARVKDQTNHGGSITGPGAPTVLIGGLPAARVGDFASDPLVLGLVPCIGGPIVTGQEDYNQFPFNLATEGHRQPGSSFKPFTLAVALESGPYLPDSIIDSAPQDFIVPNSGGKEHFGGRLTLVVRGE